MKGTEHFTRTIAEYLNQRAMTDPLFAPNLMKPNKNIEECITYILNEVQKSGCNGFDDDMQGVKVNSSSAISINILIAENLSTVFGFLHSRTKLSVRDFPISNLEAITTISITPPRQEAKPTGSWVLMPAEPFPLPAREVIPWGGYRPRLWQWSAVGT